MAQSHALSSSSHSDVTLQKMPMLAELFSKAVLSRGQNFKKALKAAQEDREAMPKLGVHLDHIKPDIQKVRQYAKVCGFNFDGLTLPLTFPHVLAFNLHLKLMTHRMFPLPIMGLIHVRNTITSYRSILANEFLDLHVCIGESRLTNKGFEFDIHTQVNINNSLVWESTTTNLFLIKKTAKEPNQTQKNTLNQHPNQSPFRYHQLWPLAENLGRRYAWVSGDANPIHLHKLSAKLLGFKQAITHGMWLKAHTLASLNPIINEQSAITVAVAFKQETPLNNEVKMHYQQSLTREKGKEKGKPGKQNSEINFDIRSLDGGKLHMTGKITFRPKLPTTKPKNTKRSNPLAAIKVSPETLTKPPR